MKIKFSNIGKIEFIVFVGGAVVMILELTGSRILAPFLGNSIFVWTSLIGIILGALSIGYHLGGRLSAEKPSIKVLALILLFSGILVLISALVKTSVLETVRYLSIQSGSILATLILFGPPSVVLGMISPYAIRLKVKTVEGSGGVAGNLYAISTVGSIFGTFLAGFYLIPTFGSTQLLFVLSAVLILSSLVVVFHWGKFVLLALVITTSLIAGSRPVNVVYETDSAYNHIRVVDFIDPKTNREARALYLATETHSLIFKDNNDLFAPYHKIYQLDNLFMPEISSALTLGGGAYVSVEDFLRRYPQATMEVVEIDPKVTETARQYFRLKDDPRLTIHHQDGRRFLNNNQNKFDIIYGDAFTSFYSLPFQLTTREAVQKMYDALNPNGVAIINVISSLSGEGSIFLDSEYKTLAAVFPQVYVFPVLYTEFDKQHLPQNILLVASKNPTRLTADDLFEKADDQQKEYVSHLWDGPIGTHPKSIILTDEHAPVDYFISKIL